MNIATTEPGELPMHLHIARRLVARPVAEPVTLSLSGQHLEWLESLMAYDPETGAFGNRHFNALAGSEWERALRAQRELSFVVLRLREARFAVDSEASIALLRSAVSTIRGVLRSGGDAIGRLDALELAVLLPETGSAGARDVVSRLIPALDRVPAHPSVQGDPPIAVDLCSVTLSRHSVGEKGWQGALGAARNLLDRGTDPAGRRVMHLDILAAHRPPVC